MQQNQQQRQEESEATVEKSLLLENYSETSPSLVPWYYSPCFTTTPYLCDRVCSCCSGSSSAFVKAIGALCCCKGAIPNAPFGYEVGDDAPFLPSTRPTQADDLPPPPAKHVSGPSYFAKNYGVHSPCCFGQCLVTSILSKENFILITFSMIFLPAVLFFIFVAKDVESELGVACLISVIALTVCTLFFLSLVYLVEPGILPISKFEDRSDANNIISHSYVVLKNNVNNNNNGGGGKLYFDKRAFRAQFSKYTQTCIENFDHYCTWVSNAIGKRNYRYFVLFLTCCLLLCYSVCICCFLVIYHRSERKTVKDLLEASKDDAMALILGIYGGFLGVSLIFLYVYHLKAVWSNVSTAEDIKRRFIHANPYDLGGVKNCVFLFCGPHYPSRIAVPFAPSSSGSANGGEGGGGEGTLHVALLLSPQRSPGSNSASARSQISSSANNIV